MRGDLFRSRLFSFETVAQYLFKHLSSCSRCSAMAMIVVVLMIMVVMLILIRKPSLCWPLTSRHRIRSFSFLDEIDKVLVIDVSANKKVLIPPLSDTQLLTLSLIHCVLLTYTVRVQRAESKMWRF